MPDPAHPPSGCAFHTRCPRVFEPCARERPALVAAHAGRRAAARGRLPSLRGRMTIDRDRRRRPSRRRAAAVADRRIPGAALGLVDGDGRARRRGRRRGAVGAASRSALVARDLVRPRLADQGDLHHDRDPAPGRPRPHRPRRSADRARSRTCASTTRTLPSAGSRSGNACRTRRHLPGGRAALHLRPGPGRPCAPSCSSGSGRRGRRSIPTSTSSCSASRSSGDRRPARRRRRCPPA